MNRVIINAACIILCVMLLTIGCRQSPDVCVDVVDVSTSHISRLDEVIESQELIPLANIEEASFSRIDRTFFSENYYILKDRKDILYVFEKDGSFVSNSRKVYGRGSGEYVLCLAYSYNQYSHDIEIVVPDGIMFYDVNFNFIKKVKFKDKKLNSMMFNHIYDVDASKHILFSPQEVHKDQANYYVYDSQKEKVITTTEYPRECQYITMQRQCISGGNFIAFPCMNYTFYELDGDQNYNPVISLNFGENAWQEKDPSDSEGKEKLLTTSKSMPLRTFRSGDFVVSLIKEGNKLSDFKTAIIDTKNRNCKIIATENDGIKFPMVDYFSEKTLYSFIAAYEKQQYVDTALLDESSRNIYNSYGSEANYIVLKSHLK